MHQAGRAISSTLDLNVGGPRSATVLVWVQRKGQSHPDLQIIFVEAGETNRLTGNENIADAVTAAHEAKAAGWLPLY
jgi:hypothetical protein